MIETRIHGRGGQGNVSAAYLLGMAAFEIGKYCQAFPAFGAERRGAPVVAFVRISDKPILQRNQVKEASFLIIQDATLLYEQGLTSGLRKGGGILINSNLTSEEISKKYGENMISLPGTSMALEQIGRPVPNVALLSAFLTLTGIFPQKALQIALKKRFSGRILDNNLRLTDQAAKAVPEGLWKEKIDAIRA